MIGKKALQLIAFVLLFYITQWTSAFAQNEFEVTTTVKINVCGDNTIEGPEDCESNDLNGKSCQSLGFGGGTLSCDVACTFDTSSCITATPAPSLSPASAQSCNEAVPGKTPVLYAAIPETSTVNLFFKDAGEPFDKYYIEYGTKSGAYSWSAANIGKEINNYVIKLLSPNTKYYFRIRTGNGCATGAWSNEISTTTSGSAIFSRLETVNAKLEPVLIDKQSSDKVEKNNKQEIKSKAKITIKVVSQELKPMNDVKVRLLTVGQELTTNEQGMVFFEGVGYGNQTIQISTNGYENQQSIFVTQDAEEFNLTITVNNNKTLVAPATIVAIASVILITLLLLIIFALRKNKKTK